MFLQSNKFVQKLIHTELTTTPQVMQFLEKNSLDFEAFVDLYYAEGVDYLATLCNFAPTAVHIDNQLRRLRTGLYELLNIPSDPAFITRHQGRESFDADEPAEPNQFLAACKCYLQRACIGRSVESAYYDNF
jgi:hypothetical protein